MEEKEEEEREEEQQLAGQYRPVGHEPPSRQLHPLCEVTGVKVTPLEVVQLHPHSLASTQPKLPSCE